MLDVTDLILRYRECARHTWNSFYRGRDEAWADFLVLSAELMRGIVFNALDISTTRQGHEPAIVVTIDPSELVAPVFVCRPGPPGPGQRREWREARLPLSIGGLDFLEFFDFTTEDDQMDFLYARCKIPAEALHAEFAENEVLVEVRRVKFFFWLG
jgi:hypothetical protein